MPAVGFVTDRPGGGSREILLSRHAHIDLARELAVRGKDGVAKLTIRWGIKPPEMFSFEIHADGSVHCSDGYEAIVQDGKITGFRKTLP
jgi:hypothetical protein